MKKWVVLGVLCALLASFSWEVLPKVMQHWSRLGREVGERRAFSEREMSDLVRRYPTFMARVAEETVDVLARGALWPALERAWETNSVVLTARGVSAWVANNFFVRMLSPQSVYEYAALVLLIAVVIYGAFNLIASSIVANGVRHHMKAKYAAGRTSVPVPLAVVDD